jgi:hypothetical protein
MRHFQVILLTLMLALVETAVAAPAIPADVASNPVYYLPAVANTVGLDGAQFRTRVFIYSTNSQEITLNIVASTPDGFLTSAPLSFVYLYSSDNILEDLFQYTGGAARP